MRKLLCTNSNICGTARETGFADNTRYNTTLNMSVCVRADTIIYRFVYKWRLSGNYLNINNSTERKNVLFRFYKFITI